MTRLWTNGLSLALTIAVGLTLAACTAPEPPPVEEASPVAQGPEVGFRQEENVLHIEIGGLPFADYVFVDEKISRPYFAHVKTPSGVQATRNHPPIPDVDATDHAEYHPGVWMAFGDISGNDYWRNKARVEHEGFVGSPEGGPGLGTFTVKNAYWDNDGANQVVAEEVTYTISAGDDGYLLLWDSVYSPYGETESIVFGDQEEMGLGIRVQTQITEKAGGEMTDATGRVGADAIWSKQADWIDYSGTLDGHWVGITIMPDPANFRPSWYHARDYGVIVANALGREAMQAGEKSAVPVAQGETLRLRYGVLVHSTASKEEMDLAGAYQRFLSGLAGE